MAYSAANLSALVHANGFTLFHYKTADTDTQVSTVGYFNAAAGQLRVGDMIIATASTGHGHCFVASNAAGVVDVTDITVAVDTE